MHENLWKLLITPATAIVSLLRARGMDPTVEILKFSESRELWQQDALRRLAVQGELTDGDREGRGG